jgi:hypothetical protein
MELWRQSLVQLVRWNFLSPQGDIGVRTAKSFPFAGTFLRSRHAFIRHCFTGQLDGN